MTTLGVRLALDIGRARIGVAKSDPHGILASPYTTVLRQGDSDKFLSEILEIVHDTEARVVYVGDPINLKGKNTESTSDAQEIAMRIAQNGFNVRLLDERFTTVTAQKRLHLTGKTAKSSKNLIDQSAAAVLLEHALETERATGKEAGYPVKIDN